jgi:hypothetical protein
VWSPFFSTRVIFSPIHALENNQEVEFKRKEIQSDDEEEIVTVMPPDSKPWKLMMIVPRASTAQPLRLAAGV